MSATVTLTLPVQRNGSHDVATVRRLQEMLNVFVGRAEEGGQAHPIAVDGEFGPQTEQAVRTAPSRSAARSTSCPACGSARPGTRCRIGSSARRC
jgi:peptidoglycan hydrolase-like protein with peptidoglycan-binding domain